MYKVQVGVVLLLHKLTAGFVPKPALLQLMGGTKPLIPYRKARLYNFYYEKMMCYSFLAAMAVAVPALWRYRRA